VNLLKTNVQDPAVREIVLVEKSLTSAQLKIAEPGLEGVVREADTTAAGNAVGFAMDAKSVQMEVTPAHRCLENTVQRGDAGLTTDQKASPNQWTDGPQHNAKLVEAGHGYILSVWIYPKFMPS